MNQHDPDRINRLIGNFMDLQEQWESDPAAFDWSPLQALARDGAFAYNEGAGPSFHALALDGVRHGEFHERFLAYSLQAGFDPFKLARTGSGTVEIPVLDHGSLAEEAQSNPASTRMRASLMDLARARFEPLAQENQGRASANPPEPFRVLEACAESIPLDLLQRLAPELARSHHGEVRGKAVNPIEGYLTNAEQIVDNTSQPYG